MEIDSKFGMSYVGLELYYNYSRNKEKTLFSIEKALTLDPTNKFYLKNFAIMLISQQKHAEALKYVLKALVVDPYFEKALVLAGVISRIQGTMKKLLINS